MPVLVLPSHREDNTFLKLDPAPLDLLTLKLLERQRLLASGEKSTSLGAFDKRPILSPCRNVDNQPHLIVADSAIF